MSLNHNYGGYGRSNSEEVRDERIAERIGELMHKFPFRSEKTARRIVERELALIDEMHANDGEW